MSEINPSDDQNKANIGEKVRHISRKVEALRHISSLTLAATVTSRNELSERLNRLQEDLYLNAGAKVSIGATEFFAYPDSSEKQTPYSVTTGDFASSFGLAGIFGGLEIVDRISVEKGISNSGFMYPEVDFKPEDSTEICIVLLPDEDSNHPDTVPTKTLVPLSHLEGPIYEHHK